MEKKQLTPRELSEEEGIEMNTSGTRLLNLYRKRLVVRVEKPTMGKDDSHRGRQYIYQSLLS
jgi:transcription initiation factor IIE alpha subunit